MGSVNPDIVSQFAEQYVTMLQTVLLLHTMPHLHEHMQKLEIIQEFNSQVSKYTQLAMWCSINLNKRFTYQCLELVFIDYYVCGCKDCWKKLIHWDA
jgi:hypothetical protein